MEVVTLFVRRPGGVSPTQYRKRPRLSDLAGQRPERGFPQSCLVSCISDLMAQGQVVTDQLIGSHLQDLMHVRIGEVERIEILNVRGTYTPTHLKGVDSLVDEVPEQLGPCSLFLTRRIPDTGPGSFVIPTVRRGRIGNPDQGPAGWALVPESSPNLPTRARTNPLEQIAQT